MSWEVMYEWKEKAVCACGKGFVTRICYEEGDDWNRFRDGVSVEKIECENCSNKYHIEGTYLVPNGETLNIKTVPETLPFEQFITFDIRAVALYPKETLIRVVEDMRLNKCSTRVTLNESKNIVLMYYRAKKSKMLSNIIEALNNCIEKYDEYEWTYNTIKSFRKEEAIALKENEMKQKQIIALSHKLIYKK